MDMHEVLNLKVRSWFEFKVLNLNMGFKFKVNLMSKV
jgi:hypothetical protein